jgi:hypothetical protein
MNTWTRRAFLAIALATAGLNSSCSSSSGPEPGTPAYFWAAAKETFAANDYVKTSEHLDKLLASENDYTARIEVRYGELTLQTLALPLDTQICQVFLDGKKQEATLSQEGTIAFAASLTLSAGQTLEVTA